jgi:hypothetical protein
MPPLTVRDPDIWKVLGLRIWGQSYMNNIITKTQDTVLLINTPLNLHTLCVGVWWIFSHDSRTRAWKFQQQCYGWSRLPNQLARTRSTLRDQRSVAIPTRFLFICLFVRMRGTVSQRAGRRSESKLSDTTSRHKDEDQAYKKKIWFSGVGMAPQTPRRGCPPPPNKTYRILKPVGVSSGLHSVPLKEGSIVIDVGVTSLVIVPPPPPDWSSAPLVTLHNHASNYR